MARLTLNNEGGYASGTITVFGTKGGQEDVTIVAGAHVTLLGGFQQGGDTLHFAGNAADYTVVRTGTTIMFTDDAGTSVSLPVGPNGVTTLTFADGSFDARYRSEEHTSELQSLMRISYAVFCLKKKKQNNHNRV